MYIIINICKYIFFSFLFSASPIMIVTEYMANGSLDSFLRVSSVDHLGNT